MDDLLLKMIHVEDVSHEDDLNQRWIKSKMKDDLNQRLKMTSIHVGRCFKTYIFIV